jgi:outer membrane protein assembly factor BamB
MQVFHLCSSRTVTIRRATHALRTAALLCAASCLAGASGPAAWESNSWADFLKGRFSGVALTREGRLTLAPRPVLLAATGEAAVWSVIRASDGALWFSTGHRGRLFRIAVDAEKALQVWSAQQPEIFALAPAPGGAVYAATSPGGTIWRVDAAGKAEEWFDTKAKYVWSLAAAADGSLFAGTGDDGKLWRISAQRKGEIWYETGQSHITALAFDASGALLAGSEPNGNLYRIPAKDRATVVLHSPLPEIREIAVLPDGALLVGALGGGLAQKQAQAAATAAAAMSNVPAMTTTITITADSSAHSGVASATPAQAGVDIRAVPKVQSVTGDLSQAQIGTAALEVAGVEKSALYRLAPNLNVETLWSSKEENLLGLAVQDGTFYLSTDLRGRVYSITPNGKSALIVETGEGEATRLLASPGALIVATGTQAKLLTLREAREPSGTFEAPVFDAGSVARWGRLAFRGDLAGGRFLFRTRSGNAPRPDKTWSEWSEPLSEPDGAKTSSPAGRYVQWKVEMQGPAPSASRDGVSIDAVTLSYLPQNNRPAVHSISVTPQWVAVPVKPGLPQAQIAGALTYSVTVSDSGESGPNTTSGTPIQQVNRAGVLQLFISWQADDPDNDRLVYTLQVRGEDEREWKTLKRELIDNTFALEADTLADGRYRFRVIASDRLSNPPSQAREADLDSPVVLLDQTPPHVVLAAPRSTAQGLEIEVDAEDALSPVRRAEVSLDAGPWRAMECADGVADSRHERFTVILPALTPGEHLVTVRVYDASGNAGLARQAIR